MIILRYQMDLSNTEISESLGITKENVEVRMHRARRMLRSILMEKLEEGRSNYELPGSK
jgi:RNA polymerase sigma-70 factor (ECF subfamily)